MNCSGKFFVPIVICGPPPPVAVVPPLPDPPPPHPLSNTISRAAAAAMARARFISGYGGLVAGAVRRGGFRRQREAERTALPGRALGPDPPTVLLDDPLAHGEPDAGARVGALPVEAVERLEDLVGLARLHADAVVADREPPRRVEAL